MGFPNEQNNAAAAIPVWLAGAPAGSGATGVSGIATVDASGTDVAIPAGTIKGSVLVQNTSANSIYLSFQSPATVQDIKIAAGASLVMPFAIGSDLYGLSSDGDSTLAYLGF